MKDEFGCEFSDAAVLIYRPEDEETSIAQQVELEKEKLQREYSLNYSDYELVFDRFIADKRQIINSTGKCVVGAILFRAYSIDKGAWEDGK